jgi:hypothetical protein
MFPRFFNFANIQLRLAWDLMDVLYLTAMRCLEIGTFLSIRLDDWQDFNMSQ